MARITPLRDRLSNVVGLLDRAALPQVQAGLKGVMTVSCLTIKGLERHGGLGEPSGFTDAQVYRGFLLDLHATVPHATAIPVHAEDTAIGCEPLDIDEALLNGCL